MRNSSTVSQDRDMVRRVGVIRYRVNVGHREGEGQTRGGMSRNVRGVERLPIATESIKSLSI